MNSDKFTLEILPDGTIKTTTDGVSAANHDNAENFLRNVARLAGGQSTRVQRADVPKHVHEHSHSHTHSHTHDNLETHKH